MSRYTYLDLMRGLAAFAVLLFHYAAFFLLPWQPPSEAVPMQPYYRFLWPFYNHGGYAVQMFWALSGIVFMKNYGYKPVIASEFIKRRIARLYPLHIATLIIMLELDHLSVVVLGRKLSDSNTIVSFIKQLFFISDWSLKPIHSYNFPIWSVSMEVMAYAIFLIIKITENANFKVFTIVAGFALIVSVGLNAVIFTCVSLFFIGSMIQVKAHLISNKNAMMIFIISISLSLGVYISPLGRHIVLMITYIVIPSVLLVILKLDMSVNPATNKLKWIGDSSYSIYLLHIPILFIIYLTLEVNGITPASIAIKSWFLIFYVVLVVAAAVVTNKFFEIPTGRLLLRLLNS